MTYLKIVLTVIAVLLTLHLIKPLIVNEAKALTATVDVNIMQIGGRTIYGGSLPVDVTQGIRK